MEITLEENIASEAKDSSFTGISVRKADPSMVNQN